MKTWDIHSNRRIETLHPAIREDVYRFINTIEIKHNIYLRITQALRTFEEQDELYAQGRTKAGNIVTKAKGGDSFHNYGLAFDICEIKDKQALWSLDWDIIVPEAKKLGFEWGGDFKSISDKPHFQKTFGLSIADCKKLYIKDEYIKIA